jgi:hypothetical protein
MRFYICVIVTMLAMIGLNCQKCDPIGGTREGNEVPYACDASAIEPYLETKGLAITNGGCDTTGCLYYLLAETMLHNPTNASIMADITCEFFLGDGYSIGVNTRKNVGVSAHKSRPVEIQESINLQGLSEIRVNCEAVYH